MKATGQDIVDKAKKHIGEEYILGATVALNEPFYYGPWDCSLFASKMVFESSDIVYGCIGYNPATADPYTGAWANDVRTRGIMTSVSKAALTPGAFVLRIGQRIGHIAICKGKGITIEAKGTAFGVCEDIVEGRRWDMGVLVPGIIYTPVDHTPPLPIPKVYRLVYPNMQGKEVIEIQKALLRVGCLTPNDVDGIFGANTSNAVIKFQRDKGLVVDGEVGSITLKALGIIL